MEQVARCALDCIASCGQAQSPDVLAQVREWLVRNAVNFEPWEASSDVGDTEFGYIRQEPLTLLLRPKAWQSLCDSGRGVSAALNDAGLVQHKPVRLPGGKLVRFRIIDGCIMPQRAGGL